MNTWLMVLVDVNLTEVAPSEIGYCSLILGIFVNVLLELARIISHEINHRNAKTIKSKPVFNKLPDPVN